MADYGWYEFRRNPSAQDIAKLPILKELMRNQYYPIVYEVWLNEEAPATNFAEIANLGGGSHFDGSATAAVVYYDSASANDTSAGVGIRTIKIFGLDEAGTDFQEVTDSMAGATGTATAEKWTRLNNVKGATAGANGDAEGEIYIQDDAAGTTKHLNIDAAAVAGMNARFYFPYGWTAFIARIEAHAYKAAHATEGFGDSGDNTISGVLFKPVWSDNSGIAIDEVAVYPATPVDAPTIVLDCTSHVAQTQDEECYLSLQHVSKEADNLYRGFYKIWYVAYKNTATGRGLAIS